MTSNKLSVSEIVENIGQIISALQARNDSVIILLEQIAPGKSEFMTPDLEAKFRQFNQQILSLETLQTNTNSKIIIIDMAQGWRDEYLADDVHYNQEGALVVAERYYQAIEANVMR